MKQNDPDNMKIGAIAPWFGGKRNLAPKIIEFLGPHRVYWELFCGSMAVLLAKKPCVMETACDLHGDLINLARVLQSDTLAPQLFGKLSRTLICEDLHREAAERYRARGYFADCPEPDLERAYDWFICSWIGRNGVAGTVSYNQGFCIRYTSNGGHAAKRWLAAIESIPAWHYRLQNVTILRRDAFEILERIADEDGAAIYCDPPYLIKGTKYIHDFKDDDHSRLAQLLKRFKKTRVVLSYYAHPKLKELYAEWQHNHIEVSKAIAHGNSLGTNKERAVEVLLINQGKDNLFNPAGSAVKVLYGKGE